MNIPNVGYFSRINIFRSVYDDKRDETVSRHKSGVTRSRAVWSLQIMPVLEVASACFSFFFFFSFVLRSFFFLHERCILFFHESTHQLVPLLISQSIYDLEKKFDAYRKSSHQSLFYFSNHLFVYGNIKVKIIFNLTNRPLIRILYKYIYNIILFPCLCLFKSRKKIFFSKFLFLEEIFVIIFHLNICSYSIN